MSNIKDINKRIAELKKEKKTLLNTNKEFFNGKKLAIGLFNILDPVAWAKDLVGLLNVRKLVIYGIILASFAGFFYNKGKADTPIRMNLEYTRKFELPLNGETLLKPKNSNDVYIVDTKTGKVLKHLRAKDFPQLREKLKVFEFKLRPIFVGGIGIGELGVEGEVGAGVSFFRWMRIQTEAFLTMRGIYAGVSYNITDNSGVGLGAGRGFKGDDRVMLYYRTNF